MIERRLDLALGVPDGPASFSEFHEALGVGMAADSGVGGGEDMVVNEESEKRLRAIEKFTDLGSGFKVAMEDLEIRGAGNILGHEQHGYIAAIGFDLYCKLLNQVVITNQ